MEMNLWIINSTIYYMQVKYFELLHMYFNTYFTGHEEDPSGSFHGFPKLLVPINQKNCMFLGKWLLIWRIQW